MKAENAKLKRELQNSGYKSASKSINKNEPDPREATRQHLDKNAPLKDVWLNLQKSAMVTDVESGTSQTRRYCDGIF